MRALERDGKVLLDGDGLTIERSGGGVVIEGRIQCAGGITIYVTKRLTVLGGDVGGDVVQTDSYTYHVMVEGLGNLLRYCGPHDDEAHPEHKPFHHKHTYNVLRGDVEGGVSEIEPERRPTLAEVIIEACRWYYDHADEIEAIRAC